MNCYNHPSEAAVAQCIDCGKGLCSRCAATYPIMICNSCNRQRIQSEKSRILKELIFTFILGVGLAYLFGQAIFFKGESFSIKTVVIYYIIHIYIFAGIVSGWKTLTSITPRVFLILPIIGWLLYFIVKLFLSFWIGLVMLPVRVFRNIYRLKKLQGTGV